MAPGKDDRLDISTAVENRKLAEAMLRIVMAQSAET